MIISSDTQYPWTNCTDGDCEESQEVKEARAWELNLDQRDAMLKLAEQHGNVKGIIINGDLTSYGHPKELKKYKAIWNDVELPIYEGLGNHDYLNNVNDTWLNQAANGMMDYMYKRTQSEIGVTPNWTVKSGFFSKTSEGSLAYSWDVGNVHFVQLQNFPTYEHSWSTFVWTSLTRKTYHITNSLDWLEADLKAASEAGKLIVLNYHDSDQHWIEDHPETFGTTQARQIELANRFTELLARYPVAAVFAGHYHRLTGPGYPDRLPGYIDVPVFYSGSTSQSKFLLVSFYESNVEVEAYQSFGGEPVSVPGGYWTLPVGTSPSTD